jgi:hypothetical protein
VVVKGLDHANNGETKAAAQVMVSATAAQGDCVAKDHILKRPSQPYPIPTI